MADPTNSSRRPVQIPAAEIPSLKTLLSLAVFVVIVAGLYLAREVLIPVTLAVLLSFILAPLAGLLRRLRLGKAGSVLVAVVLAMSLMLAIGALIGTQLADLARDAPRYQATIQQKVDSVRTTVTRGFTELTSRFKGPERPADKTEKAAERKEAGRKLMAVEVHQPDPTPLQVAEAILAPAVSPLTTLGVVFVVSIFVLIQREDLRNRLIRLFGSRDLHRTTVAMDDAASRLSRYFLTQLALNGSFGLIVGVGLYFIGVPSPLLWGVLGALLRFVPYVGAILSAVGPMALAAAVEPGWSTLLWTTGLYLVVESLAGQVIEPLIYGHSTGLSALSVVVAAIFWTWLWGPIGLVLSTPLTMCLVVLGRHVERLEFLDVMLGDAAPLTPVETFYQRLLADDVDDAVDQAETSLKTTPLTDYYDTVVLKGLQLAANDHGRGVMPADQLDNVKSTSKALLDDLTDRIQDQPAAREEGEPAAIEAGDGAEPARPALPVARRGDLPEPWRVEAPVLCLAGRGPLDDAAAAMLAQVLQTHGLDARTAAYEAVSRTNIGSFDASGIAMICVCYLEIAGSPSHLRFLLRRLRQRMPGIPILVGFWPSNDPALTHERIQATIGADHYGTSLRDSVSICLAAAGIPDAPKNTAAEAPVMEASA